MKPHAFKEDVVRGEYDQPRILQQVAVFSRYSTLGPKNIDSGSGVGPRRIEERVPASLNLRIKSLA